MIREIEEDHLNIEIIDTNEKDKNPVSTWVSIGQDYDAHSA